jgi:hypothetical protein
MTICIPEILTLRWDEASQSPSIPRWESLAYFAEDMASRANTLGPNSLYAAALYGIALKAHHHALALQPKRKS